MTTYEITIVEKNKRKPHTRNVQFITKYDNLTTEQQVYWKHFYKGYEIIKVKKI